MSASVPEIAVNPLPIVKRIDKGVFESRARRAPYVVQNRPVDEQAETETVATDLPAVDVDARLSLESLRNIVVGPAMKLSEDRLEELVRIMEERETESRKMIFELEGKLKQMQEAHDADLRKLDSDFALRLDDAVGAATTASVKRHDDLKAQLTQSIGEARDQTQTLSEHFEQWAANFDKHISGKLGELARDTHNLFDSFGSRIAASRRTSMNELGRAVSSLADLIAREGDRPAA